MSAVTRAALVRSEERLRSIIGVTVDGILVVRREGAILFANPAAQSLLGKTEEQLLGRPFGFPLVTDMSTEIDLVRRGSPVTVEMRLVETRWAEQPGYLVTLHDITERKLAEEKLSLFRNLLDNSSDGIEVVDPTTLRLLDVNATTCRELGYSREELLSMHIPDIDQDSQDAGKWIFEQLRISGSARFETIHRRKDGSTFPVEVNARWIEIDQPYVLSVVRDVTERKRAERQIQDNEQRLDIALSSSGLGVCDFDLTTDTSVRTVRHDQIFGYREPAPSWGMGRYVHHTVVDDRQWVKQCFEEAFKTGTFHTECRIKRADDNSERWIVADAKVFRNGKGQPVRFLGVVADITERKHREALVRKLSLAVEQSPDSIVITDLDARIEYVNDAFLRVTGYSREEAIGRNPRILNSGKTPQATYAELWATLTLGKVWQGEFINRRKDGSEYAEFASISPIRQADGRITHYLAVKEDITEKKRLGAELDQHRHHLEELVTQRTLELQGARQAADAANQAKSDFLANMSHELRTPMNAIIGFSEILKDGLMGELTAQQQEYVTDIYSSGNHLLALINEILDLSKVEAGKMTLELEPHSVPSLVQMSLQVVKEKALRHRLRLTAEIAEDLGEVWLDERKAKQILYNLLSNAVKFTPDGGEVSIAARQVGRATVPDGKYAHYLELAVKDSGIGISAEDQARLFQPFTQIDSALSRKYEGTGLGLVMVKRLAELHGGAVALASEPGKGAIFTVWLPWRTAAEQPPDVSEPVPSGAPSEKDR